MKTKTEILKEFCEKEFSLHPKYEVWTNISVGITGIDCECCGDYLFMDEISLNKEIDEARGYLDHLIGLRDDMKGRW